MAVTYMLKLEEEPQSYDRLFTSLTQGRNQAVFKWITDRVISNGNSHKIIDVGCGPGSLAIDLAQKGYNVVGIDGNPQMVEFANTQFQKIAASASGTASFQTGSAVQISAEQNSFDVVTSTFMLSELRPFRQLQFLQQAWRLLKSDGVLYLAEEFEPKGFSNRFKFAVKRWWYSKKLSKNRNDVTHPLKWLINAFSTGFEIKDSCEWDGGIIRVYALKKKADENPLTYRPGPHIVSGWRAYATDLRCLLTGQIDHVAIEPGIYSIGTPTPDSPVFVTANYVLTYHRVVRALKSQNCWILVVDSNGINVWCAARGGEFGNAQIMEATAATGLENVINHNTLILPQLSAGGVGIPDFPSNYSFKIKFGPVWIKDLLEFQQTTKKDQSRKIHLAEFTLGKRLEAGITHVSFLYRKALFWPSIFALPFMIGFLGLSGLSILGQIWGWTFILNMLIAIGLPITYFSRQFNVRGLIFAGFGIILGIFVYLPMHLPWSMFLSILAFLAWIPFFSTMSFSGYTMNTSYREIKAEFILFQRIQKSLFLIGLIFLILYIFIDVIGGIV